MEMFKTYEQENLKTIMEVSTNSVPEKSKVMEMSANSVPEISKIMEISANSVQENLKTIKEVSTNSIPEKGKIKEVSPNADPENRNTMEMSTNSVPENGYKCTLGLCDNTFSTSSSYESHLETVHIAKVEVKQEPNLQSNKKPKMRKCEFCELEINVRKSNYKLITYIKTYHLNRDITALVEKLNQDDTKVMCNICGKELRNNRILKTHIELMHTELKTAPCPICGKMLKQNDGIIWRHLQSHNNEGFTCEYCGKILSSKKSYKGHKTLHMTDIEKVQCDECHLQFDRQSYLYWHKKRIHSANPPVPKTCNACGKQLSTLAKLRAHISSVHLLEKPFSCELCEYRTSRTDNLKTHMRGKHKMDNYHFEINILNDVKIE